MNVAEPASQPRKISEIVAKSPRCRPQRELYAQAVAEGAASWNQVESGFLEAMSAFDADLAATADTVLTDDERTSLSADIQNGKGDFFNDLLALLLRELFGDRQAVHPQQSSWAHRPRAQPRRCVSERGSDQVPSRGKDDGHAPPCLESEAEARRAAAARQTSANA